MKKTVLLFGTLLSLILCSCAGGSDNPNPPEPDKYTVTWKNYDGTVLETDTNVPYGSTPTYDGETPTHSGDAQYSYTFSGWSPEISTVKNDATYVALYKQSVNKYLISFNSNGGSSVDKQVVEFGNKVTKPSDPIKAGYNFINWTYKGEEWSFIGYFVTEDMTLDANWSDPIEYSIEYNLNGGTESTPNPAKYTVEDNIIFSSPTKEGYSFDNWTIDGEVVTGIEKGTTGDKVVTANWTINKYQVNVYSNDENKGTVTGTGEYDFDSDVTVTAIPNNGYKFDGWYDTSSYSNKVSSDSSYTIKVSDKTTNLYAKFVPIEYNITYVLNGGTNSGSNPTTYDVEQSITFADPIKTGYSFANWMSGGEVITGISKGTTGDITVTANWTVNKYQVNVYSNDESKGTVTGCGEYNYGSNVTVTATPIGDYVFNGWYSNSELRNLVSKNESYTFIMSCELTNLYAKFWTKAEEEEAWNKAHGVIPVIDNVNKTITYGLYPQTNVNDVSLINSLNSLTTPKSNGWYFYENEYYAKLTAKPYQSNYQFDNGKTIVEGQSYWFKCEPITWNILSNNNGEYFVLSSKLLDTHIYDDNLNNYKDSKIRSWLNNEFYYSTFSLDSSYILTTEVDNSPSTTDSPSNPYACENTFDKVFLPSYKDYLNSNYGFVTSTMASKTRECKTTDYARANGARSSTSSSYFNNGYYLTRSPYSSSSSHAWYVRGVGDFDYEYVYDTDICVRPSLSLNIVE